MKPTEERVSRPTSAAISVNVLDHATSEIASPREINSRDLFLEPGLYLTRQGSKLGIDATKKLPGEGFKRPWPPLIKMDETVRRKVDSLFRGVF